MRILYVTTISNTVNAFLIPHIRMLVDEGHQVDVAFKLDQRLKEDIYNMGCKVYDINFNRNPLKKENYKAYKKLKGLIKKEKYDIVHCHTPVASFCTRLACRKIKDTRVFYTAHGFHFYKGAPLKNWWLYYPIEKWLSRYTDTILTINNEDYERAKTFYAKKVIHISGIGLDLEKFKVKVNKKEKRKLLGIQEEDFLILSVGELNKNKNHQIVIKAIKKLNNLKIKYIICGVGPLKEYLEKLIKELELENQVQLLGYRKDIVELNKISDLFVFPSKREGLPVSVMEAMASGLPVIASNIRGNRDLINNEKGGYLFKTNSEGELISCLNKVIENDDKNQELCNYNKEKIKKFGKNNILIKLKNVIKNEKNIKILYIINNLGSGGAEKLIESTLPLLNKEKDVIVEILLLTDENNVFDKKLKECGIKINVVPYRNIKSLKNIFYIRSFITNNKYDIVHVHLFPSQYWVSLASFFILKNKPLFLTTEHSTENRRRKYKIFRIIDSIIYHQYKKIICISEDTKYNLKKWIISSKNTIDKFQVINNGININIFKNAKKYNKGLIVPLCKESSIFITMVGRFCHEKDQETLIRAFYKILKIYPDSYLILVGEGPLLQEKKKIVKKLKLEKNIYFLGFRKDIERILKTSDVIVLSSYWEGFGLSAVEGMASGKPVIVSKVKGLTQIVENYGLVFNQKNSEELFRLIYELLSNKGYFDDISVRCLKRSEDFDIKKMIKALTKEYIKNLK